MSKTIKIILWIILAIIVIGGIWYGVSKQPKEQGTIKIGFSGALTGEIANWGKNVLAGVSLAIKEVNDKGGINGRKIELVTEDDKSLSSDAVTTFNKLINIDKVMAIIGGSGSGGTAPALPIAQSSGTPVIIAIASAPNLAKTGDFIFRVTPSDSFQGEYAANFIFQDLAKKKVALVYAKNDWGEGLKELFKKRFSELGGEIVYESSVLLTDTDFKTEISKIKESGAETLYFPVYPDLALIALKQMKEMNLNLTVVCGDAIDGSEVIKSSYAEGVIYTIAKINLPEDFMGKIKSQAGFEDLQVTIAAPLGYDAAKVLLLAIEKVGTDRKLIRDALEKTSYQGVSNPIIEFDENGDIKSAVFEARIIKDKKYVPYEK